MEVKKRVNFEQMLKTENAAYIEKIDEGEYQILDRDGELICELRDNDPDFDEKLSIALAMLEERGKYCTLRYSVRFEGGVYKLKWHDAVLTRRGKTLTERFDAVRVDLSTGDELCVHSVTRMSDHEEELFVDYEELSRYVERVANDTRSTFDELEQKDTELGQSGELGVFEVKI